MNIGIDFGSKNISAVIIDNNKIINSYCINHNGDIKGVISNIINEIYKNYPDNPVESYGLTGNIQINDYVIYDSIVASIEANKFLKTNCRNILNIGCETFSLTILDENFDYLEHTINPLCASGTGSFIDQQAERIGITTEELAEIAYNFKGKAPSIATRCAVFAKSDIIHSQAEGYSKEAIAAGLCCGMAMSILANLLKGRELIGDVIVTGGVSKNKKIVLELSKLLEKNLIVINESQIFNAIGAAIIGIKQKQKNKLTKNFDLTDLISNIGKKREIRNPLIMDIKNYPDFSKDKSYIDNGVEVTLYENLTKDNYNIYIGIDIGSTSTKLIVTDEKNNILLGLYTKTAGEPVVATQKLLKIIQKIFNDKQLNILGVGTTGSGRKLLKQVLNADMEINEITAHAKGATFLDKDVDTIIEIGGQDSKFTILKNGNVISATMNYVCAAGTGSFIEEQAKRLGISLDDISNMAENKKAPYTSDRCTVYMERDLNIFMREGFTKEEIITAVLHSVRDNYLSKVVGRATLGEHIFFQGATARNKALVSAFQQEIGKPIFVSKYCHLTGALGVAVLLKEKNYKFSTFRGIDFKFSSSTEICNLCINKCALTIYTIDNEKLAWGLKCGREYESKKVKIIDKSLNIEKKFNEIFFNGLDIINNNKSNKKIGIPKALYMVEYFPLFKNIFQELGYEIVVEQNSNSNMKIGSQLINSDFCAPIIASHGIVKSLLDKNVDYIFFPTIINEQNLIEELNEEEKYSEKITDGYYCYYSEYSSTIINNLTTLDLSSKLLSPLIKFNNRDKYKVAFEFSKYLNSKLNIPVETIETIFLKSIDRFNNSKQLWKQEGKNILDHNKNNIKIVFFGRPYSFFDSKINLNIPWLFQEMGFDILYQSMLDNKQINLDNFYIKRFIEKMHWYYGQEILIGAEIVAKSKNLYPVFLTCFRCSPDSYLITYFKELMNVYNKPFLIIQLDEHSSDVGYQTRIEAAIETFKNHFTTQETNKNNIIIKKYKNDLFEKDYTVLIPYVSPIISELQKEVFKANGYNSIVMPLEQKIINKGYKYASGGECLPNVSIAGSLIETIKLYNLNPEKTILYLPTICMACNFNQYSILAELALEKENFNEVKIANPNTLKQIPELSKDLNVQLLEINILGSLLYKLYYRFHPYERISGQTNDVLNKSLNLIIENLNNKKPLMDAAKNIKILFENLDIDKSYRKPRVGILGDLYLKYNKYLNDDIYSLIEDLGGEVLIPSFTETVSHFLDADVRENKQDIKYKKGLILFEKKYETIFSSLIPDSFEPSMDEAISLLEEYGINNFIAGETTINVSRMLYYIKHKIVDAVVHLNPLFCCPGVVSSSIFRKIQKDFNVPIIDLFYDGTNKPNNLIIPQLYYLNNKK